MDTGLTGAPLGLPSVPWGNDVINNTRNNSNIYIIVKINFHVSFSLLLSGIYVNIQVGN